MLMTPLLSGPCSIFQLTDDCWAPPTSIYVNYREVIVATNLNIEAFNIKIGATSAPKLHQSGERGRRYKMYFMFNMFRKEAKEDMMHLYETEKMKMAMRYVKYFDTNTPNAIKLTD